MFHIFQLLCNVKPGIQAHSSRYCSFVLLFGLPLNEQRLTPVLRAPSVQHCTWSGARHHTHAQSYYCVMSSISAARHTHGVPQRISKKTSTIQYPILQLSHGCIVCVFVYFYVLYILLYHMYDDVSTHIQINLYSQTMLLTYLQWCVEISNIYKMDFNYLQVL